MKRLILGGVKSGKSTYALADTEGIPKKYFIATAEALDEEMKEKIRLHQEERDPSFITIEEPLYLASAIERVKREDEAPFLIVDCLTLWVSNLLHHFSVEGLHKQTESLLKAIDAYSGSLRLVSNEVGLGLIGTSPLAREYANQLGILNQKVARHVEQTVLMVAGIPTILNKTP